MIRTGKPNDKYFLPYRPTSGWDAWFAIAVFPSHSPARWCKAHFYRRWSDAPPASYPLSLLEGMGERSEVMIATATSESVKVTFEPATELAPAVCPLPLAISFEDQFSLKAGEAGYAASFAAPGTERSLEFSLEAGWPVYWSRFGRHLQYVGVHSAASVGVEKATLSGLGVVEHVTGLSAPFDFRRVLPVSFHWDVLAFDRALTHTDSAAGLSIGFGGNTAIPLKAAARVPGDDPRTMRGLYVKYLEAETRRDESGRQHVVPLKWEGMIRSSRGTLRYLATAATPAAFVLPGGGMMGFDFEARWTGRGSNRKTLGGTGFTEYGGFTSRLAGLSSRVAARRG